MKLLSQFFVILLILSSCAKEAANVAPIVSSQAFSITENQPKGTFVGAVPAFDRNNNAFYYRILSGNTNNTFDIDSLTGIITVNNPAALDFEVNSMYLLNVEVFSLVNKELNNTAKIEISVTNMGFTRNGLVAYFPFNGDVANLLTGNGIDTFSNASWFADRFERRNRACFLPGFNSFLVLDSAFDFQQRTIAFWFNARFVSEQKASIFCINNPNLLAPSIDISLVFEADTNVLGLRAGDAEVTAEIETDKWYHVAVAHNQAAAMFFLNGQLVGQKAVTNTQIANTGIANAVIGADYRLGSLSIFQQPYFAGIIDDLLIYNRQLDSTEVKIVFKEPNLATN